MSGDARCLRCSRPWQKYGRAEEFFREVFRETFYESVEALQRDLDRWLEYFNTERPHQGYRNQGRRPIETIELYLKNVPEAA